jgi:NitT/TauT family transport system substrate-binding protein
MKIKTLLSALVLSLTLAAAPGLRGAEPLKIGYSVWPGWVAWEIAIQ